MKHITSTLMACAVLCFSAHALPQDDASADPKDELAATLKACGKPIDIEAERPEKAGDTRKVVDYPGVSLWFRKDTKPGSPYVLHTAMRTTRTPFVLDKGELVMALPCSRKIHYKRLGELE